MELAFQLFKRDWFNLSSPIPYVLLALIVSMLGGLEGFYNRYRYGQYQALKSENEAISSELRKETLDHADTKSSYFESLADTIKYILINNATGFDHRCRVTVYRKQRDQDETLLRQIFRHSPTQIFEQNGRFRIPANEGFVGAAWRNHGVKEFSCEHDPRTQRFRDEANRALRDEGCLHPECELSMPTKHYYARALQDTETAQRIGIVVYECTETGVLDTSGIDSVLDGEALDVARFVRLRGLLHSQFHPDPEEV